MENPGPLKPPQVHLVAIGNELLNGETRDTNLPWLIRWVTRRGGQVVRASIVPDEFEALKWELDSALRLGMDLFITTGGLGPTDDDCTHESIGRCLGCGVELNEKALQFVRERIDARAKMFARHPLDLTPERLSMAVIPVGAEPIMNPVGVAPGILLVIDRTKLIALPGVPKEMKGIVKETLKPFWKEFFTGVCYVRRNIVVGGIPEADLWPLVRETNKLDPGIYIKSRLKKKMKMKVGSKGSSPDNLSWWIILHFSVIDRTRREGKRRIDRLVDSVAAEIRDVYGDRAFLDLG